MDTLKDKIFDFVKAQNKPVLLSAIAKGVGCDLTAAQKAVLELHREGVLFRSLSNGKALFSANSEDGEGLTPVQGSQARLTRTLNAALGGGSAYVANSTDKADDKTHSPFNIKLSFSQGRVLHFEDYSIGVPDGFEYKTDVNGRDFAMWMPPTEDPTMLDDDGIPVTSPIILKENAMFVETGSEALSMLQLKKAYAYAFAKEILKQKLIRTMPEILETQNVAGYYHRSFMSNYNVQLIFNQYLKALTLTVSPEIDPGDDSRDPGRSRFNSMLSAWIDTVKLREPYPSRKSLDDPEFFKDGVSEDTVSKWGDYAVQWSGQYTFLRTQAVEYELYRYVAENPVWSFTACKPKLLPYLKADAAEYNKMLEETLNCVKNLTGKCSDDAFLLLCKQAIGIASGDTCSQKVDDDEFSTKTNAPQIRAKIEKISRQIEQKVAAAEHAREEAERKKKQELKQSAAVIRKTLLEQLRQRVEAEKEAASAKIGKAKQHLTQVTQAEKSKQEEELASVQAEFDSVSSALSSMGLFQFKQKSDAKAKLQQLRLQIEQIKQLCQTPESEEIRQAETAVEQAEEELEGCDTKQEKWETAVENACDVYEQRVNLHLDYISGKELHLKSKLSETELEEYNTMISANVFAFHSTLQEIIENSFVLRQLGTVKAAGIIGKMVAKGYLSRTVTNGKTYFDIKESMPVLVDDIGWDITKPPIAPDLDSIISETNT